MPYEIMALQLGSVMDNDEVTKIKTSVSYFFRNKITDTKICRK